MAIGDKFFRVYEENSYVGRKTFTFVDADGVEWHRHSAPVRSYIIKHYALSGMTQILETGECEFDDLRYDEYHIKSLDGKNIGQITAYNEHDDDFWFSSYHTREEAEIHKAQAEKECFEKYGF